MAWEKEQMSDVRLAQEMDGVYHYKSESDHIGGVTGELGVRLLLSFS